MLENIIESTNCIARKNTIYKKKSGKNKYYLSGSLDRCEERSNATLSREQRRKTYVQTQTHTITHLNEILMDNEQKTRPSGTEAADPAGAALNATV